jgi:type IV pilus assembly protein PilA
MSVLLIVGIVLAVLAVPCLGIAAAIAIPSYVNYQLSAKRSEVPGNVSGIVTSLQRYDAEHDGYIACGSRAEAEAELMRGSTELRPWRGGDCWDQLGWRPDGAVRGAYWIEVSPAGDDFTVYGISDVDGDSLVATYTASKYNSTPQLDFDAFY